MRSLFLSVLVWIVYFSLIFFRDIHYILQNQPTNSYTKYCELVGFFVSLGIPPKIRFDGQNGGNIQTNKIWQR